ncbi:MAG: hypothetical protein LQ346_002294 [Caloplaca aetnensis]|nr:MAG: hypothetical protein LQ346_002294 [Caloplaca aetnensis]
MKHGDEASGLVDRIFSSLVRQFHPEDPETCNAAVIFGSTFMYAGYLAVAEESQLETLAIEEIVVGKKHPTYVEGMFSLASIYRRQGRLTQAIAM